MVYLFQYQSKHQDKKYHWGKKKIFHYKFNSPSRKQQFKIIMYPLLTWPSKIKSKLRIFKKIKNSKILQAQVDYFKETQI